MHAGKFIVSSKYNNGFYCFVFFFCVFQSGLFQGKWCVGVICSVCRLCVFWRVVLCLSRAQVVTLTHLPLWFETLYHVHTSHNNKSANSFIQSQVKYSTGDMWVCKRLELWYISMLIFHTAQWTDSSLRPLHWTESELMEGQREWSEVIVGNNTNCWWLQCFSSGICVWVNRGLVLLSELIPPECSPFLSAQPSNSLSFHFAGF